VLFLQRLDELNQIIWEPAAGDGAMAEQISLAGYPVIASDLVDRGYQPAIIKNFYGFDSPCSPVIITNPPFCECNKDPGWVRFALEILKVDYMALLLPFSWPGAAKERGRLWADYPPARIYLMRWRIDFTGQGAPPMLNAWFVWEHGHKGSPLLHMLDKPADRFQQNLFMETTQ